MTEEEMHIVTLLVVGPPPRVARSLREKDWIREQGEWTAWWSRANDQLRALGAPHANEAAARFHYWCRKQERRQGHDWGR